MSSLRVKAEKEKELTEAETYWRKRFAKQEREVSLNNDSELLKSPDSGSDCSWSQDLRFIETKNNTSSF